MQKSTYPHARKNLLHRRRLQLTVLGLIAGLGAHAFAGIAQIEISAAGKAKVMEHFLTTGLAAYTEEKLQPRDLEPLTVPQTVSVPRILVGRLKRPFEKTDLTTQLLAPQIKTLAFGKAKVTCHTGDTEFCEVTVPLMRFDLEFGVHVTALGEVIFHGERLGAHLGTASLMSNSRRSIRELKSKMSFEELKPDTPTVSFKVRILGNGTPSESVRLTEKPIIHLPEGALALDLTLQKTEIEAVERAGKLRVYDVNLARPGETRTEEEKLAAVAALPFDSWNDDKLTQAFLQGSGDALIRLGRFQTQDSYLKFMALRLAGQHVLFRSQEVMTLITNLINQNVMPMVQDASNEALWRAKFMDRTQILRPEFNFQDEIDYPKNEDYTQELVDRVKRRDLDVYEELPKYFARFEQNTDFRSLKLIQRLVRNLKREGYRPDSYEGPSQAALRSVETNIAESKRKMELRYQIRHQGDAQRDIRLTIGSDRYDQSSMEEPVHPPRPFSQSCDLITHFSVPALNAWLREQYDDKIFGACVRMGTLDICSAKKRYFVGQDIQIKEPPRIEWDPGSESYEIRFPRINHDWHVTSIPILSMLGLTRDSISASMKIKPATCSDGKFCVNPSAAKSYLIVNTTSGFSALMGIVKFLNWPYLVLGNALANTGAQMVKTSLEQSPIDIPDVKIVEVQNGPEHISVCSQIVDADPERDTPKK